MKKMKKEMMILMAALMLTGCSENRAEIVQNAEKNAELLLAIEQKQHEGNKKIEWNR